MSRAIRHSSKTSVALNLSAQRLRHLHRQKNACCCVANECVREGQWRRGRDGKKRGTMGLERTCMAVKDTRSVDKSALKLNSALPKMDVDPQTYEVFADGEHLTCEPAEVLPLAQRYLLL